MFGYVKTDLPNMYVKDTVLYKAMYCGLCKSIGGCCGQRARFCLNYDLAFLSAFLHNICDKDVKIEKQRCIIHHIVKRPVAVPDNLSKRIANFNVILAYYKLCDDVIDNGKGRVFRLFIKKAYKKAKRSEAELDLTVKDMYAKLRKMEKEKSDSIDMVADPFGEMMVKCVKILAGEYFTDSVSNVSYNLGKWIYLIDALDDFDKDKKKKNFNVLLNAYSDSNSKKELLEKHGKEIVEIFSAIICQIDQDCKAIEYKFNHDLIDNVLMLGIKQQTKNVMEKSK